MYVILNKKNKKITTYKKIMYFVLSFSNVHKTI